MGCALPRVAYTSLHIGVLRGTTVLNKKPVLVGNDVVFHRFAAIIKPLMFRARHLLAPMNRRVAVCVPAFT